MELLLAKPDEMLSLGFCSVHRGALLKICHSESIMSPKFSGSAHSTLRNSKEPFNEFSSKKYQIAPKSFLYNHLFIYFFFFQLGNMSLESLNVAGGLKNKTEKGKE